MSLPQQDCSLNCDITNPDVLQFVVDGKDMLLIKSYKVPPKSLLSVVKVCCLLLGYDPSADPSWQEYVKFMVSMNMRSSMQELNPSSIGAGQIERCRAVIDEDPDTFSKMVEQSGSEVICKMSKWCMAIIECAEYCQVVL